MSIQRETLDVADLLFTIREVFRNMNGDRTILGL